MNKIRTFLFFISVLLLGIPTETRAQNDSIVYKERYGLSLGVDLFKVTRTIIDDNYTGFEINGDYRIKDFIHLAAELGTEDYRFDETNLVVNSTGSYIKLGANYNFYKNWIGMQNLMYGGFRVGLSSFSHNLEEFSFYTPDNTFEPQPQLVDRDFNNLAALWTEFQFGIRVEVFKNVYLGTHIQLKFLVSETDLQNFDNIYIPGFNITNDFNGFGFGWGYSVRYLIPFKTKRRTQAVN